MVLVIAAAVLAVILVVALVFSIRADRRAAAPSSGVVKLPVGAEAAIWSILEAVPDPRNHLALTRDLTGEVRITGTPLDPALRAAVADGTAARPAGNAQNPPTGLWDSDPFPPLRVGNQPLDLRDFERAS